MAYSLKYIMSFVSDKENDYRIEVLQQGYEGAAQQKKLGAAPVLNIEDSDGRVKGTSLTFSIQADAEGELSGLYTTNNKEYKVLLYRNGSLFWQGYLLPELYSENYVDAPYDVAVTATDQLATLKEIAYSGEDAQTMLLDIVKNILLQTHVDIPCRLHMDIKTAEGLSLLKGSYINASAFNGQKCYDVLNAILLSCNACIMQLGNEWMISSLTDSSTSYDTESGAVTAEHLTLGQLNVAQVAPEGSLTMVNAPALKGVQLDYNYILRNSFLKNAECKNRDYWSYLPAAVDDRAPGNFLANDGMTYKLYYWSLIIKNIKTDSSLQLWQDVVLENDTSYNYRMTVKFMIGENSSMLLLALIHMGDDGIERRLTASGWMVNAPKSDVNSYIQITGQPKKMTYIWDTADASQFEEAAVVFALPPVGGTLRVGFINPTEDYAEPVMTDSRVYVTDVYLTISGVAGKTATTEVEKNATSVQEEVLLSFGDSQGSSNAGKIVLNTLNDSTGKPLSSWLLSGQQYDSYYMAMLQDMSRYYGVKKMQLQGNVMGKEVMSLLYKDAFSGKILRIRSGQYNMLEDTMGVVLEEVPNSFVEYQVVVYATDNKAQGNTSSSTGTGVAMGGGETYLGLQSDGDVFVKGDRPLIGKESRFENLAIPNLQPDRTSARTYIYSSDPDKYPSVDITAFSTTLASHNDRIKTFEDVIGIDDKGNVYIKKKADGSARHFYSYGEVSSGGLGSTSEGDGSGSGSTVSWANSYTSANGLKMATITIDGVDTSVYAPKNLSAYNNDAGYLTSVSWGTITDKPTFATVATSGKYSDLSGLPTIPTSLKSPYALTFGSKTYDGSAAKTITASDLGALTSHQSIYALTINNSAGTAQVTYTPNSKAASLTLTKAMVGLGNVENTALSTWAGSTKITTVGTITSGTWNGTKIANGYLANSSVTIAGTSVSLGGSITAATLKSNLGLGSFAYISSLAFASLTDKPTTLSGYGITDAYTATSIDSKLSGYLPLSGGTISGNYGALSIKRTLNLPSLIKFENTGGTLGYLGFESANTPVVYKSDMSAYYTLIHSGNIGSYNAGSATKLQTARTIWGQSFDGTGNVSGILLLNNGVSIQSKDSSGANRDIVYMTAANQLVFGTGAHFVGGDTYIGGNALYLRYGTTPTVGLALKNSGNVLIGTTTDNGSRMMIHSSVSSSARPTLGNLKGDIVSIGYPGAYGMHLWNEGSGNGFIQVGRSDGTAAAYNLILQPLGGNVGIGTVSPSYKLHVAGVIYTSSNLLAAGDVTSGSDERYKEVISHAEIDINTIANAPIINFKWTDREDARVHLGSTAQYWYGTSLSNGVIPTTDDKLWTMGYGQIALASVVSVAKKVVNHEEEIKNLKKKVNELENELEQYRRA